MIEALTAPVVTAEQTDLVKRTLAPDFSPDELKLFFYDCARQGVHPLDKLIHPTKRGGRYTPITSIDFMRMRAAETNEYAGSDDAVFEGTPKGADFAAHVTVYRLVQGQRCAFSATARWSEYCPPQGQDLMWRKMPFTMLAKCCEALALRKGFPRQLAGLYAKEELDQAEGERPVEKAVISDAEQAAQTVAHVMHHPPFSDALEAEATAVADEVSAPPGAVFVRKVEKKPTKKPNVYKYIVTFSSGEEASTISQFVASRAQQLMDARAPITMVTKSTQWGTDLVTIAKAEAAGESLPLEKEPLTDSDIPF